MRVIIFLIPMLLIVTCPTDTDTDQEKAKKHYYKAKALYKGRKIDDKKTTALKEIEKAIALDSSNRGFQMLKAQIIMREMMKKEWMMEAEVKVKEVLGVLEKKLKNKEEVLKALEALEKKLKKEEEEELIIIPDESFAMTDNYEQAIKILTGLLSKNFKPDTVNFTMAEVDFIMAEWYFNYGDLLGRHGHQEKSKNSYEKAVSHYGFVINNNTQYHDAYVGKQKALHNLQRYSEAVALLDTAVALFPDKMTLILERGVEKVYAGDDFAGAMEDLNKYIQSDEFDLFRDLPKAYRFRGIAFAKTNNIDQALSDFATACESDIDEAAREAREAVEEEMRKE